MTEDSKNQTSVGRDVFVSYASQDASVANTIVEHLERQGIRCWMAPRDVTPGSQYADEIVGAINDAKVLVLVLSEHAIASTHVGREIERAASKRRRVIALKTDAAPLTRSFEYFLSESQWIDVAALGMPAALARLAEAVGQGAARALPGDSVMGSAPRAGVPEHGHGLPIKMPFLERLKRRNVGRVAILYVGVCYLILEFFSTFLHVLALPEWTGRTLAALMVAGFPVVLLLSWIFELTPQGIKPAAQVEISPSSRKLTGRRLDFAIIVVLVLALGYFAADKFWLSKHTGLTANAPEATGSAAVSPGAQVISDKSIAVLPFADMSQKKDQEYFGDGMAEEILDLLAKIPGLTVIGRTSSFQFKGKNEDLRKIGSELNAAYVLEGSVRNSGDQVRITAQLINTRTGAHEWSETYDRQRGDVLKLQDAIAASVARELQLTVAPGFINRTALKNTEAYDLYLRGRHAADRWDKEGFDEAVALFQQALDRDGTFADAAAELAFVYEAQGEDYFLSPADAFEQARRAASMALNLDPKSARAHFILGLIHVYYDWDWTAAGKEFQQVAVLAPGSADAPIGAATVSLAFGHFEESFRQMKAALAQDPVRAASFYQLTEIQLRRGRLSEAEAAMRRGLDIHPTYEWGHWLLGVVLLAKGDRDAALIEMQRVNVDDGRQLGLALVDYALGKKAESDAALALVIRDYANQDAFEIANVYAFRLQPDEAMHWLDRAYAQRDAGLFYIKVEWPLKNLEGDPRYKALVRKMNLSE